MKTTQVKPIPAALPDAPAMLIIPICPTSEDLRRFWWLQNSTSGAICAWMELEQSLFEKQPKPNFN